MSVRRSAWGDGSRLFSSSLAKTKASILRWDQPVRVRAAARELRSAAGRPTTCDLPRLVCRGRSAARQGEQPSHLRCAGSAAPLQSRCAKSRRSHRRACRSAASSSTARSCRSGLRRIRLSAGSPGASGRAGSTAGEQALVRIETQSAHWRDRESTSGTCTSRRAPRRIAFERTRFLRVVRRKRADRTANDRKVRTISDKSCIMPAAPSRPRARATSVSRKSRPA